MDRPRRRLWPALYLLAVLVLAFELVARLFVASEGGFLARSPDPRLGFALRPGAFTANGTFLAIAPYPVRVNDRGCRDAPFTEEDLGEGTLRALFLGDSFTFSAGVPAEEGFPALLQKRLAPLVPERRLRTMNCGVVGYNLGQLVRDAERRAAELRPEVIVLVVYYDDLQGARPLERLLPEDGAAAWLLGHSRTARFAALAAASLAAERPSAAEIGADLDRLRAAAEGAGARLLVALLQEPSHPEARLTEMLEARGIAWALAPGKFFDDPALLIPRDEHWNAAGHREFAAWLAPLLLRELRAEVAGEAVNRRAD